MGITKGTAAVRFTAHVYNAVKDGYKTPLHAAIRKYGKAEMRLETLVIAGGWDYLCELEKKAIAAFETRWPNGYNITKGGDGFTGIITDEHRLKISKALKGRVKTPAHLEKISNSLKGKVHTEEFKQRMSEIQKNRPYKHSSETCTQISISLKGKAKPPRSKEHAAKISAALKGRKLSTHKGT